MKAVIMAGGEGTRLRPLSLGVPKPMTPLFGRPVMEHIITLLKRHHITDICVTLCYKPQAVMDYFGSGEQLGVQLTYFVEEEPLGTAGSVRNCLSHLGREDFLVISGDCVCDLDLTEAIQAHQERESCATLVLYAHPKPLEYGLVLTDEQGRVQRFVEKPSWGQVVTNMVNTGIYILSPRAMELVPQQGPFDFGKDLFPTLLEQRMPLYGCPLEGYWCDMGDCGAYLNPGWTGNNGPEYSPAERRDLVRPISSPRDHADASLLDRPGCGTGTRRHCRPLCGNQQRVPGGRTGGGPAVRPAGRNRRRL